MYTSLIQYSAASGFSPSIFNRSSLSEDEAMVIYNLEIIYYKTLDLPISRSSYEMTKFSSLTPLSLYIDSTSWMFLKGSSSPHISFKNMYSPNRAWSLWCYASLVMSAIEDFISSSNQLGIIFTSAAWSFQTIWISSLPFFDSAFELLFLFLLMDKQSYPSADSFLIIKGLLIEPC